MIRALLRLAARSIADVLLVCLLACGLLGFVCYRILRRLATDNPSDLEEYARILLGAIGTAAALAARERPRPPAPPRV